MSESRPHHRRMTGDCWVESTLSDLPHSARSVTVRSSSAFKPPTTVIFSTLSAIFSNVSSSLSRTYRGLSSISLAVLSSDRDIDVLILNDGDIETEFLHDSLHKVVFTRVQKRIGRDRLHPFLNCFQPTLNKSVYVVFC